MLKYRIDPERETPWQQGRTVTVVPFLSKSLGEHESWEQDGSTERSSLLAILPGGNIVWGAAEKLTDFCYNQFTSGAQRD